MTTDCKEGQQYQRDYRSPFNQAIAEAQWIRVMAYSYDGTIYRFKADTKQHLINQNVIDIECIEREIKE